VKKLLEVIQQAAGTSAEKLQKVYRMSPFGQQDEGSTGDNAERHFKKLEELMLRIP
jgi:hypothetical protein